MIDVIALGELLVDMTPAGETDRPLFESHAGGAPANVLAGLAGWGRRTAFIGKVGRDGFGDFLAGTLRARGIDTGGLRYDERVPTTLALVHLGADGERSFAFYRSPGADVRLAAEEVDRERIASARIFHFGSVSMTHEPSRGATMEAASLARSLGLTVSFDPNLRPALWDSLEEARASIEWGLRAADVAKLSEEELAFLTGTADADAGAALIAERYGCGLVLVTLGEKGCYYRLGGADGYAAGFPVAPVDTTGAGDAFVAGVLHRVLASGGSVSGLTQAEVREAAAFGNAAGALATTRKGAIPAMPAIEEIRKVMNAT